MSILDDMRPASTWRLGGPHEEKYYSATEIRRVEKARAVQTVPNLRERLAEAHDASLDDEHRDCRAILMECIRLLDAAPQPPVAEPSVNDEWFSALLQGCMDDMIKARDLHGVAIEGMTAIVSMTIVRAAMLAIDGAEAAKKGQS